jgi:hypothetical protein
MFTIVFIINCFLLAIFWHSLMIVLSHKVHELILSRDWRSFVLENVDTGIRIRIVLMVVYLSSLTIFFYWMSRFMGLEDTHFPIIYILGIIVGVHLLRIVATVIINAIFSSRASYRIWIESYLWIHFMLGILFIPLALLATYSPEEYLHIWFYIGLSFMILAEIMFFYRMFLVFYSGFVSFFYLFLYLCTLEILPLLFVVRLITTNGVY